MNDSKKRISTFLIVSATMLLSFFVGDAILSALGSFIVLDRISVFFVIAIAFVFGLVKACSGMKVSEIMLTMLLVVLFADGVGVIGFSILSANYLSAIFLIPLVIISFALIFIALSRHGRRSGEKKGRRIGKAVAALVFSLVLLALISFAIVYFHAERLITLPALQKLEKVESIDFKAILGAFEAGFDLNRTVLTVALAVSALAALVSAVRHKGKGYGTLAFLLGMFFFDGIGICWFAFRTGDYLTGGFLIPLMIIAFSLVIGAVVSRITGWKPDKDLLGKAMLVFAMLFLAVFIVGVGFYYVKTNTAPDEVLFDRELPTPGVVAFGAGESFGKGSLAVPLLLVFVAAVFLFIATKLSEYPFRLVRRDGRELPWRLLLSIEGFVLSFAFIAMGFSFYGVMGAVLLGLAIAFIIAMAKRKKERRSSRSFIAFFTIFLLLYVGGLLHFRESASFELSLPGFAVSAALGAACAVLLGWALRFLSYKFRNRETIKVIAILVALVSLIALCLFGYFLRIAPPQQEEPVTIVEEKVEEVPASTEDKTPAPVVDVEETPEPECEVVDIPTAPNPVMPPETTLVDTTDLVPSMPVMKVTDRSIIEFIPRTPSAPEMAVADASVYEFAPRVPSAPEGLTSWGWTYDDGWDDGWDDSWSEDDFVEDTSDDDFWADFYIAGENELELEDGFYYMQVYINGYNYGEVEINIANEDPGIPTDFLTYYLDGELTEEAWTSVFSEGGDYVYLSHFDEIGVETRYDKDNYEIFIDFDTIFMPIKTLSISSGSRFFKTKNIEGAMECAS